MIRDERLSEVLQQLNVLWIGFSHRIPPPPAQHFALEMGILFADSWTSGEFTGRGYHSALKFTHVCVCVSNSVLGVP